MNKAKFEKFLFEIAIKGGQAINEILPRKSKYARDFSKAETVAAKTEQPLDYLRPVEVEDPDEAKLFQELKEHFAADVVEGEGAAAENGAYQDAHWGHTTGFFAGTLDIKAGALNKPHKDFRVGLFEHDRTYDVVVRPNFLFDDKPQIAISRMSIKIKYPDLVHNEYTGQAKELDLLLSEGLPLSCDDPDGQGFFFRDARQMLMLLEMAKLNDLGRLAMVAHGGHGSVLKSWKNDTFEEAVDQLYEKEQRRRGWAGKHFFSAGPYALDDGAMKFCLEPHQEHQLKQTLDVNDNEQGAERRKQNWPDDVGDEVKFTLKVQIATASSINAPAGEGHPPKSVMAAEYTDLEWDDNIAPFEDVGTLTIKRALPDHWRDVAHWASLPMNAFNTFRCTRPLGQLFRARQVVHKHHRKERLRKGFKDPTGGATWTCPFSGIKRP